MAGLMGMTQSAGGFDSTQSAGGCTGAQSTAKWGTQCPRSPAEAGRTLRLRGSIQEELPHAPGQGQWLSVPGCEGAGMDKRSYSTSEIRGIGREEVPQVQGHGRWPKVQGCDSTGAAQRSYPVSEVRGGVRMCKAGTAQKLPRGGTSRPRPGVVAKISNPTPKERWLHWLRRAQRSHSTCKVRKEA